MLVCCLLNPHTHHFSGCLSGDLCLPVDFVFALVLNLCILLELVKTFHILSRPLWLSSVAWLEWNLRTGSHGAHSMGIKWGLGRALTRSRGTFPHRKVRDKAPETESLLAFECPNEGQISPLLLFSDCSSILSDGRFFTVRRQLFYCHLFISISMIALYCICVAVHYAVSQVWCRQSL